MQKIVFVYDLKRSIANQQFTVRLEERAFVLNRWAKKPHRKLYTAKDLKSPEIEGRIVDPALFRMAFLDEAAFRKTEGRFFSLDDEFTLLRLSSVHLSDFVKTAFIHKSLCDDAGAPLWFDIQKSVKPHITVASCATGYRVSLYLNQTALSQADYFLRSNRIIAVCGTTIAFFPDMVPRDFMNLLMLPRRITHSEFKALEETLNRYADYVQVTFQGTQKQNTLLETAFQAQLDLNSFLDRGKLTFVYGDNFVVRFHDEKGVFYDFDKKIEIHRNYRGEKKLINALEAAGVVFHPPGKSEVYLSFDKSTYLFRKLEQAGVRLTVNHRPFRTQLAIKWRLSLNNKELRVSGKACFDGEDANLSSLYDAYLNGKKHFSLPDESVAFISTGTRTILKALEAEGDFKDTDVLFYRGAFTRVADIFEQVKDVSKNHAFDQCLRLKDQIAVDLPLPPGLGARLWPYQARGYEWLMRLKSLGFCGILADDMGLGKTLQTLTFLLALKQANPKISVKY